jgi:penicillin-insensitive murein endopeptidase
VDARRFVLGLVLVTSSVSAAPTANAISVGAPNHGELQNARALHTGKRIRVVETYASDDARYGTEDLVLLLEHAAHRVAQIGQPFTLAVGDLSKQRGGPIARHASHQSGRDADLGFYLRGAKGQVLVDRFLPVDAAGRVVGNPSIVFDDARNWALVDALLDTSVRVTHIFVAPTIRTRLLAYAAAHDVSPAIRLRAAMVLMQPSDAPLHDDHFHVRIGCPTASQTKCVELALAKTAKP